jgi:hypothetical protein
MLNDTTIGTNRNATTRLTITEAVKQYAELGVTEAMLNFRANKKCAALGGRVECIKGKWKVSGARVFEVRKEKREYPRRGITSRPGEQLTSTYNVRTAAREDLELIAATLAAWKKQAERFPQPTAKRLGVQPPMLEYWATKFCPVLGRTFRRVAVINPASNRGFDWAYNAVDEKAVDDARRSKENSAPIMDLKQAVSLKAAAAKAKLKMARTGKEMRLDTAVRYLKEQIAKGHLAANKEPDPNRHGKFLYTVTIADVLNLKREVRNSWKPAPTFKVISGERCALTEEVSRVTGCSRAQLDVYDGNADGTPGGVKVRKHLRDEGGRERVYWSGYITLAKAIEAGDKSPALARGRNGSSSIELPPVKLVNNRRHVPTHIALALGRYEDRNELVVEWERTGKPHRHQVRIKGGAEVKTGGWKRDYWDEAECKKTGDAKLPRRATEIAASKVVHVIAPITDAPSAPALTQKMITHGDAVAMLKLGNVTAKEESRVMERIRRAAGNRLHFEKAGNKFRYGLDDWHTVLTSIRSMRTRGDAGDVPAIKRFIDPSPVEIEIRKTAIRAGRSPG